MNIVNISNPLAPVITSSLPITSNLGAADISVDGSYACLAYSENGLVIVDVSNVSQPVIVTTYNTPGRVDGVEVQVPYAYLADGTTFTVLNISNPTTPVITGIMPVTTGSACDVFLLANSAFVADYYSILRINIQQPSAPVLTTSWLTHGYAQSTTISGTKAYFTDGGLVIFNITNPNTMVPTATYNTGNWAMGVDVSGNRVYLADGALRIFDVTNPGNPVKLGEYISPTGNGIQNIAVQGNYIYLGDGSYGFRILDITNPASPQLVSSTSLTNMPWGVTVSGDYVYLACWAGGLVIYNISNPSAPVLCGSFPTVDGALAMPSFASNFPGHLQQPWYMYLQKLRSRQCFHKWPP